MKKHRIILAAILLLALVMTGCTKAKPPTGDATGAVTDNNAKINMIYMIFFFKAYTPLYKFSDSGIDYIIIF